MLRPIEAAWALFDKVESLYERGQTKKALAVCEEIVARFGAAEDRALRREVAWALYNKGMMLWKLGRKNEALPVYDEIVARFGKWTSLREVVARALSCKGLVLDALNRKEELLPVFNEIVARFGAANELALREVTAWALFDKAVLLCKFDRQAEALPVCEDIVARFGTATAPTLREVTALALSGGEVLRGQLVRPETKALLENDGKPAQSELVLDRSQTDDAPSTKRVNLCVDEREVEALEQAASGDASPAARVLLLDMVARARTAAAETTRPAPPKLSDADLAAFMAYAKSHKWKPRSVAPSAFIAETFKEWLGRGLRLKHIHDAQKNLAAAYSAEVSRAPSKRVAGLSVAQEKLPVGAPRPPSIRPVAELSEKEKAEKRPRDAAKMRRWRQSRQQLSL